MSYITLQYIIDVIAYPCWELSLSVLVKGVPSILYLPSPMRFLLFIAHAVHMIVMSWPFVTKMTSLATVPHLNIWRKRCHIYILFPSALALANPSLAHSSTDVVWQFVCFCCIALQIFCAAILTWLMDNHAIYSENNRLIIEIHMHTGW